MATSSIDFNFSEIEGGESEALGEVLQRRGFALIHLDNINTVEQQCIKDWENKFSETFELPDMKKEEMCRFDTYQGYTMGYRREGKREFLETRLCGNDCIEPSSGVDGHKEMVISLWSLMRKLGISILSSMAHTLGVDPRYFLDLIDWDNLLENELSSTLMRICSYPYDSDMRDPNSTTDGRNSSLAFGAHTDVSLLTLGLLSSIPGLEIQDMTGGNWVSVEEHSCIRRNRDGDVCGRYV
jgi:isopenicillin N synthase-like dioxygenase